MNETGISESIYLLGFGAVGQSFFRIFMENEKYEKDVFHVVDEDLSKKEMFISAGGKPENFHCIQVNRTNYIGLLQMIKSGDYFIDLGIDIKNIELLKYCLTNGIHYLSTADSSWKDDDEWKSAHQHFLEYKHLKHTIPTRQVTSVIEFGMNPGLVSTFVKAAITDIVLKDTSSYVVNNRPLLMQYLKENRFNEIAALLKIRRIIEIDNDNQEISLPYDGRTFYSPWNSYGFLYESISHPEIAFGTMEEFFSIEKVADFDYDDLFIAMDGMSFDYPRTVFSPQGFVEGRIVTHEEVFSIRDFLTYGEYRPTVMFIYSPCDYAEKSIVRSKYYEPERFRLLSGKDISSGGESVGVILSGDHFQTRYYGNYLCTERENETATILQVSASLYAAYRYVKHHPNEGLMFPEDLNHIEILNMVRSFLGKNISIQIS